MHESKSTSGLFLVALLPLLLLALFAESIVESLGAIGVVGVGAVLTAFFALFLGFGLPILALGQEHSAKPPSRIAGLQKPAVPEAQKAKDRTGGLAV